MLRARLPIETTEQSKGVSYDSENEAKENVIHISKIIIPLTAGDETCVCKANRCNFLTLFSREFHFDNYAVGLLATHFAGTDTNSIHLTKYVLLSGNL